MKSEKKRMNWRTSLRVIWIFVKRDLKLWTYFKINFIITFAGLFSGLAIYAIIAGRMGRAAQALTPYGGDYVSYVILGIVLNSLLSTSLSAPYQGVRRSDSSRKLEIIMLSPMSLPLFITGITAGAYVRTLINITVYLLLGFMIFGLSLSAAANYGLAIIYVLLGVVSCTGLGLAGASTISLLDARGGDDPIRWIVQILAGLGSGAYYPVSILPEWIQNIASLIPHTYAFDGTRRALLAKEASRTATIPAHHLLPISPLLTDMLILALMSIMYMLVGWRLFEYSMKRARTDGRLSRWV